MTTAPYVPAPPPGPGVHPPFPAPPVEGKGRRIGWSLGISAVVLLLVCGGGVVALIGLISSMGGALNEQAQVAVRGYLDAVRDRDFDQAYRRLCASAQQDVSPEQFRRRIEADEPILTYSLGKLDVTDLTLPVDANYAGGQTARLEASLEQNRSTGALEVCAVSG
jgi:hypothetical protein